MAVIEKNGTTYEGFKETNGNLVCENCGGNEGKMVMHLDGKTFYTSVFECKCGNRLSIKTKRIGENAAYWED